MALSIRGRRRPLLLSVAGTAMLAGGAFAQKLVTFDEQVEAGSALYAANCAMCHGAELQGQIAGPLAGPAFLGKWGAGSATVADLYGYIHDNMPPGRAGALSDVEYAAITAFIMRANTVRSEVAIEPDPAKLREFTLPSGEVGVGRQPGPDLGATLLPGQQVGGELAVQHQHRLSPPQRQVARRGGDAMGRRRNDRHAVDIAVEQPCGALAQQLGMAQRRHVSAPPRCQRRRPTLARGRVHRAQQRRLRGAVQVQATAVGNEGAAGVVQPIHALL